VDILLAHGYFLQDDPVEQRIMKPYVPLGILAISAYLEREGFVTEVFDATFESLGSFQRLVQEKKPPVVGVYVNMMTKFACMKMIRIARETGAFVIVGGPEPAYYAEDFLENAVDAVVVGEGEVTVREILERRRAGETNMRDIAGVVYRGEEGRVVRNRHRDLLPELDALPQPDRSKIDLRRYVAAWRNRHSYSSLSVVTMRGCPYACKWCSHGVYGESYRRRSPALVVDELETLRAAYNPDAFWFADDVFTINHPWFFEFQRELRRRDVRIRYECITRADRMNEEIVLALRDTGCTRVWIGSESGSQKILDAMARRVTTGQIRTMTTLAQRHGIEVGMFLMLGYRGETRKDIEETVRHVRHACPDIVLTTVAYPIKGTAYYNEIAGEIRLPQLPFPEWNDRMIQVQGRFSRRFYWFANRRIVNEASVARLYRKPRREWGKIAESFVKAKIAQLGMTIVAKGEA